MSFEIIEHTGDVGIRYFGSSVQELFSSAINGTANLIGDPGENCTRSNHTFEFQWTDLQDLMYQLLDKLIYVFEVEEVLLDTVESMNFEDRENTVIELSGCCVTEAFQPKYIMKAPTYHQMELRPDEGYGVQIFDV